ncbi:MAG: hypothetical protein VCF07_10230 [Nitrospinota bacterium]
MISRNELGYPQFSGEEWARRDAVVEDLMERENLSAIVVHVRPRGGSTITWLA